MWHYLKRLAICWVLWVPLTAGAQSWVVSGTSEGQALASSQESLPFWTFTNSSFERGDLSNASLYAEAEALYVKNQHSWNVGLSGFVRDGVVPAAARRDLYINYSNPWVSVTAGARKRRETLGGLSSSNGNFLWSNNARPLPGVIIEASEPLALNRTFSLDWGIAHYQLNDDRFVEDTRVHYKRLGIHAAIAPQHSLAFKVQHFVQWGGTSPIAGALPDDFEAFFKVFLAKDDPVIFPNGEPGDNALGNHLGSYFLEYQWLPQWGTITLYHEHPLEDGSGTALKNFPDGIWGLYAALPKGKIFQQFLYEFITTTNQSGDSGISSNDNYFSNAQYRSGWSYEGNIIGLPFIVFDRGVVIDDDSRPVTLNNLSAHHLGAKGSKNAFYWTVKLSYVERRGRASRLLEVPLENWYTFGELRYASQKLGTVGTVLGADFSPYSSPVLAAGLTYSYSF
jgi:hypothetical protein